MGRDEVEEEIVGGRTAGYDALHASSFCVMDEVDFVLEFQVTRCFLHVDWKIGEDTP